VLCFLTSLFLPPSFSAISFLCCLLVQAVLGGVVKCERSKVLRKVALISFFFQRYALSDWYI